MKQEISTLNLTISTNYLEIKTLNKKISELQEELNQLKSRSSTLEIKNNNLEANNIIQKKQTKIVEQNEKGRRISKKIKTQVKMEKESNIFGVLLKKTGGMVNKYLDESKTQAKQ